MTWLVHVTPARRSRTAPPPRWPSPFPWCAGGVWFDATALVGQGVVALSRTVGRVTVALRNATSTDVPALLAFWKIAAEDTNRVGDDAAAAEALIRRDQDALQLAVDGGEIVGSLIAGFDGWRCHLYRFAVHPQRRRQGIGRMLLDAAEARFRRLGGRRADAMVLEDNVLAHPAWAAQGYVPQPDWRRWVKSL